MSSFNESVGLGYLKTNAIEFVKYPLASWKQNKTRGCVHIKLKVKVSAHVNIEHSFYRCTRLMWRRICENIVTQKVQVIRLEL